MMSKTLNVGGSENAELLQLFKLKKSSTKNNHI